MAGDTAALRRSMKANGFSSSSQSFCVANPSKLAAAKARFADGRVPAAAVAESRLLAWLALKHAKAVERSSAADPFALNGELKAALLKAAAGYPDAEEHAGRAEAAAGFAAGQGVGGGRGRAHPAVRLLAAEKELLLATAEAL